MAGRNSLCRALRLAGVGRGRRRDRFGNRRCLCALARALESPLGPRRAAIGAVLAFLLTESHLLARPHVLALPLLVIWMSQ